MKSTFKNIVIFIEIITHPITYIYKLECARYSKKSYY